VRNGPVAHAGAIGTTVTERGVDRHARENRESGRKDCQVRSVTTPAVGLERRWQVVERDERCQFRRGDLVLLNYELLHRHR
jgi:hypothetical protein